MFSLRRLTTAMITEGPTMNRRGILLGFAALLCAPSAALANKDKFVLDAAYQPQFVTIEHDVAAGTILIDAPNRFLYLVSEPGVARRYGIGVGKAGLVFRGSAEVGRKAKWPSWRPTDNMIKRDPKRYKRYAGGMKGGPGNPLGSRALYLYRNGQDTLYRIHGTTEPWTIGKAVSNGCIRMLNEHVEDLYERVPVGAPVVVLP